ncbi:hypothetical protein [Peribacillus sp. NPDC101480]|uniref:hypothetical protein n=1 Tax=Peribacillus sp. NPDC101480 TaxID=3390620 RepID=UPI003D03538D
MKKLVFMTLFLFLISACSTSTSGNANREYVKKLDKAQSNMEEYANDNFDIVQDYLDVWYNDLNSRLAFNNGRIGVIGKYNQYVEKGDIKVSLDRHKKMEKTINELKDTPSGYEKVYESLVEMFEAYDKSAILATNPAYYLVDGGVNDYEIFSKEAENTNELFRDTNDKAEVLIEGKK